MHACMVYYVVDVPTSLPVSLLRDIHACIIVSSPIDTSVTMEMHDYTHAGGEIHSAAARPAGRRRQPLL